MMSVAAALAVLDGHLVAAGATITPAITDVHKGARANLQRRIDYWLAGFAEPRRFGGQHATLTDWMIGLKVTCCVYIPITDISKTYAANIETDLYTVAFNIAALVMGDASLGGNCTAVDVGDVDFDLIGTTGWLRVAAIPLVLDFVDQITIAL
jgi:hypothetical protein